MKFVATEYGYFQNAVLVNFVEYNNTKKDKYGVSAVKLHSIFAFYFLKITSLNWSLWLAMRS